MRFEPAPASRTETIPRTLGSRLEEACLRYLEITTNAKGGKHCTGEVQVVTTGLVLLTGPAMAREVGRRVLSPKLTFEESWDDLIRESVRVFDDESIASRCPSRVPIFA